MAKRKVSQQEEVVEVTTQEVTNTGSNFLQDNAKYLTYGLLGLVLAVAAWYAYKNFVVAPNQKSAVDAIWQAQARFEQDSFDLALNNPGPGYDGFLTIIDKYSGTPAANTAKYYAGVCYLQMGKFDDAIKYLEDFSPEGNLLPIMKYGNLGDCYSEKGDFGGALSQYAKATSTGNNEILTAYYLKKLGQLSEHQGKKADAYKAYEKIKKDFPSSTEARDIEKYMARTKE